MKLPLYSAALALLALSLATSTPGSAQTLLHGRVTDADDGQPLIGANVVVKGTASGAATGVDGSFEFEVNETLPVTLAISYLGYRSVEFVAESHDPLRIELEPSALDVGDVIVSASRVEERLFESPVTVMKMDIRRMRDSPAPDFWEGLQNLKEIEMVTNSLVFRSISSRGFGGAAFSSFVQVVDGMDNAPIANGQFAIGNAFGLPEIDIESVEILPGAASALYGPNAFYGILFQRSRSPFEFQGLSAQFRAGALTESASGTRPMTELQVRYAAPLSERIAFKLVGSYLRASDWEARDFSPSNGLPGSDPGYQGVNVYGDEIATTLDFDAIIGAPQGTFGSAYVARTGYREGDLYDYSRADNLRLAGEIAYRLNPSTHLFYRGRMGTGNAVYQGSNRYGLDGMLVQYHAVGVQSGDSFLRAYTSIERGGDSYDIVFAGWNVNRAWKGDTEWFTDYAVGYLTGVSLGASRDEAHEYARAVADAERLSPGTAEFDAALQEVRDRKDFATGAGFTSKSAFYQVEGMYDVPLRGLDQLQIGGSFRSYDVNTEGTIYSDGDHPISVSEYGAFLQAGHSILDRRLKLLGSVRLDGHENFDSQLSPRLAASFAISPAHNVRFAVQRATKNPRIQDQYINLDLGILTLLGGSRASLERLGLVHIYEGGAVYADSGQPASLDFVKPQRMVMMDLGYRGVIADRLVIDANAFQSDYESFLGASLVVDPSTGRVFSAYTNTDDKVQLRGVGIGLEYDLSPVVLGLSHNYQNLANRESQDFYDEINMPRHKVTLTARWRSANRLWTVGGAARWRESYTYQAASVFGEGELGGNVIGDVQVSRRFPSLDSMLKFGMTNVGMTPYEQAVGSVTVGSTLFLSWTYDPFSF